MKRPRRRRKKEKKTLVFEIKLSENANSQYEYNCKDMVRSFPSPRRLIQISRFLATNKKPIQINPEDESDFYDDFIEDTEATDEFVPDKVLTELGGFYINFGWLKYTELDDEPRHTQGSLLFSKIEFFHCTIVT